MSPSDAEDRMRMALGTATEALLSKAFENRILLNATEAAELLGVSQKTLAATVAEGLITSTMITGRSRRFSERDLRLYLTDIERHASLNRTPVARSVTRRSPKPVGFTEQRAKRRAAKQLKAEKA